MFIVNFVHTLLIIILIFNYENGEEKKKLPERHIMSQTI